MWNRLLFSITLIIGIMLVITGISFWEIQEVKASPSTWYDTDWGYRKLITIDNTMVSGSSSLSNYPLLVSFTSSDITKAQTDGDDLVFTDYNENLLDYEIESYDDSTGTIVAWVRIPTLSNSTDTDIYLYYGNATTGSLANPTGVWNSNYKGVWHMNQDPSGTSPQVLDSTSNNNDGTSNGSMTSGDLIDGKLGKALDFDGSNDSIQISGLMGSNIDVTLYAWANLVTPDSFGSTVIDIGDFVKLKVDVGSGGGVQGRFRHSFGVDSISTGDYIEDLGWYQVAFVVDSTNNSQKVYINGVQEGSSTAGVDINYTMSAGTNTFIGAHGNGWDNEDFGGQIDEVRVYAGTLSVDWLLTEYRNHNNTSTYQTVGSEQTPPNPTFAQSYYRWYEDNDAITPTEPWGTPNLGENTAISLNTANNPPKNQDELRLRVGLTIQDNPLNASTQQFGLQYKEGTDGSCTTGSWNTVGAGGSGTVWRFADSSITDGQTISTTVLTSSNVGGEYAKSNPTATNGNGGSVSQIIEYDFHLQHNGASDATQYSFRVTNADYSTIHTYSTCPTLTTAPGLQSFMRHGRFFQNGQIQAFYW